MKWVSNSLSAASVRTLYDLMVVVTLESSAWLAQVRVGPQSYQVWFLQASSYRLSHVSHMICWWWLLQRCSKFGC